MSTDTPRPWWTCDHRDIGLPGCPVCDGRLDDVARAALVEAREALIELAATLANERGEGPPPVEGWIPQPGDHRDSLSWWELPGTEAHVMPARRGGDPRLFWFAHCFPHRSTEHPTARSAMRAASAMLRGSS